jgi:hypothetical protein
MTISVAPQERVTRELVLLGDETPGRRRDRNVIAKSECEITLPTNDAMQRCIAALKASDEKLANQPASRYDWTMTWAEHAPDGGGKVVFGVHWYDEEFFQEKKDTFLRRDHLAMYANIGTDEGAVSVRHWHSVN